LAKNLNNWGPSKKTQLPGGMFVKPKEKCKTFPYCNQGDSNSLDFSKTGDFGMKLTKKTPKKKKSKLMRMSMTPKLKTQFSYFNIDPFVNNEFCNTLSCGRNIV
jgi:hypothetical protein